MRLQSGTQLIFFSKEAALGPGAQSVFVQGSLDGTLSRNVSKAMIALSLENEGSADPEWSPTHVDLAGGGDGTAFMLGVRVASDTAEEVQVLDSGAIEIETENSFVEAFPFFMMSGGAQSEALTARAHAALQQIRSSGVFDDAAPVPESWEAIGLFFGSMFAGASAGGDFMSVVYGARVASSTEE